MDKKYYIAANWKMNGSLSFINDYFSNFSPNSENTNEMIIYEGFKIVHFLTLLDQQLMVNHKK